MSKTTELNIKEKEYKPLQITVYIMVFEGDREETLDLNLKLVNNRHQSVQSSPAWFNGNILIYEVA